MCYGLFGGFAGPGMIFGVVFHLLLVGLVLWGLIRLFQKGTTMAFHRSEGISAMDALKLRYAKGEITSDEFLQMKRELE